MMKIKHLYIHVPFCTSICSYCDFCHRIYNKELVDKWLDVLANEINSKCFDQYETIYIGGGTPTALNYDELDRLLSLIKPYSRNVKEYTVEVNPESLDITKINLFKKYRINRISMGVQSSDDKLLKLINRNHTFQDVIDKIKLLKANGLSNISIDLMYSLPGQTIEVLEKTIDDFLSLDIPHVSLYSLTIEENSIFGKKCYKALDDETEADMYELICRKLEDNGYLHYEISNFAKKGYESKHNIGYWKYEDFLGLSLDASSKVANSRWTNTRNFDEYLKDYNSKSEHLNLTIDDLMYEHIMMSLRMEEGLDIENFKDIYGVDPVVKYQDAIEKNKKHIKIENNHLIVTNRGILNAILVDFIE